MQFHALLEVSALELSLSGIFPVLSPGHAVLFPAGLFSYDGGNYARSRKGNGSDARNADLLVPDPSDLYYDRSADLSGD